ncbi:MAG: hypothetical protein E7666_04205 [Ruminococcaceae bacterium]|nr:hypothetical protein [Oscillospiraceae bacterium]
MSYKISVPIMNHSVNESTRGIYLEQLKAAKADRVFLCVVKFCQTDAEKDEFVSVLRENIQYFEQNGLEAGVWIGTTIGHGVPLAGAGNKDFFSPAVRIVNLKGEALSDTRCPLYPEVREALAAHVALVARSGAKTILLDDDFRMSHGSVRCCACEMHMKRISELCDGEKLTREELDRLVFHSPVNKYRHAWVKAQGEGLRDLARAMRDAVDAVDPTVRIGLCSTYAIWDADGCDALELGRILAGEGNEPLVRLCSAPYTVQYSVRRLSTVFEAARMMASLAKGFKGELMSEDDSYPRPRYNVPASYLELFDAVMRADGGHNGILKYMADYTSSPTYETGYFEHHVANLPLMEDLGAMFEGKTACGVQCATKVKMMECADYSLSEYTAPFPAAAHLMGLHSIPTTFDGEGICNAVFGETARELVLDTLPSGVILDAISAIILQKRGVDVGLETVGAPELVEVANLLTPDRSECAYVKDSKARIFDCTLRSGARVTMLAEIGERTVPFAYCYENADHKRFFVCLYDVTAARYSEISLGYLHQRVLIEGVEWAAGKRLPAICKKHPELYLLAKQGEGRMAVGLFNCYADKIMHPEIKLDRAYRNVRFLNATGEICGDTVRLTSVLHAYEFAAFEVFD